MTIPVSNEGGNPTGHAWLRRELNLAVPPPAVESYVVAAARRTEVRGRRVVEQYPRQYATEESIVAHIRFALRHEPIDLGVLVATFNAIEADLEAWVRAEPTGAFSRRTWFFYETFTGRMLDPSLPDTPRAFQTRLQPARRHLSGFGSDSPRPAELR